MATVSTAVKAKGDTIYRENRVAFGEDRKDWTQYLVMGDHGLHTVLIHKVNDDYDRCTCTWGAYNPGDSRTCSHIYAAHLFALVGKKEVLL